MQLFYRDATLDDLPAVIEIYNSTVPTRMVTADTYPVSVESKLNWFHSHTPGKRPLWIVENEDRKIVGWISFEKFKERPAYHRTAEISIYLRANIRGKGIGKQILQYAIDNCDVFGIKTLVGFIFAHNTPSLKLFYSVGFEDWGEFHNVAILDGVERSTKILGKRICE